MQMRVAASSSDMGQMLIASDMLTAPCLTSSRRHAAFSSSIMEMFVVPTTSWYIARDGRINLSRLHATNDIQRGLQYKLFTT